MRRCSTEAAEAKDLRDSLSEVLPPGMADNDFLKGTVDLENNGKTVTIYRARSGGEVRAVLFKVAERGYAGDIQVLRAVETEGRSPGDPSSEKWVIRTDSGVFDLVAGATITLKEGLRPVPIWRRRRSVDRQALQGESSCKSASRIPGRATRSG